jgi:uncharacterized phage-like protein YoqJ
MNKLVSIGGRPSSYPSLYDDNHKWANSVKRALMVDLDVGWSSCQILHVITGLNLGYDTWFAEIALDIGIPVHSYLPFKGQESKWPKAAQDRYFRILEKSEKVIYVCEAYSNRAFWLRDKAMIDNCDMVFCLLDPLNKDSGTFSTVDYAKSKGVEIENYWKD